MFIAWYTFEPLSGSDLRSLGRALTDLDRRSAVSDWKGKMAGWLPHIYPYFMGNNMEKNMENMEQKMVCLNS